jgi:hypothetical protein
LGEDEVTGQVRLSRDLTLPVAAGEVLGKLEFFQGNTRLGSVPLIAAEAVEVPTFRMILAHWIGPWAEDLALTQFLASSSG